MDLRNNLFRYATSELSQDAFLWWLASFALEGAGGDPALRACARALLETFVPALRGRPFILTAVERQVDHVDVLLTAVSGGQTYKILVEDKTFTNPHDHQLERYPARAAAAWPGCTLCGVYYKTGFQSDLSAVRAAGYQAVGLVQILDLMEPCLGQTQNAIFQDYYAWWSEYRRQALRFRELPPARWDGRQVLGFCDWVQNGGFAASHGLEAGYGYVPNRRGGFDGLWLSLPDSSLTLRGYTCDLYLQMESGWDAARQQRVFPIRLKLSVKSEGKPACSWADIRKALLQGPGEAYRPGRFGFRKPARLGSGRHMTIGESTRPAGATAQDLQGALANAVGDYQAFLASVRPAGR